MIGAIFRVMGLGLLRDRAAFAMAFILPPLIYVIFAAIFSGATGGDLRLKVAVLDSVQSATSVRLADAVRGSKDFRQSTASALTVADVEALVRQGEVDVGVVIQGDPDTFGAASGAAVRVIGDPARAMAGPIATGHILRLYREKLPDAAYRRTIAEIEQRFVELVPVQRQRVDAILDAMKVEAAKVEAARPGGAATGQGGQLVEQTSVASSTKASATIVYYAGAVGFLFLLFSAMQGAMTLIDERQSGIMDRLISGRGNVGTVLGGKFLFLVLQGMVQISLIFLVAALAYGVDVTGRLPEWLVITFAASAAASGLALALCALCRTRQQATTLSNFMVLVMSALGGSMVPRFLMPPWLQDLSWVIPNAWAIEAYQGLIWRNTPATELLQPVALLAGLALVAFVVAIVALRRTMRA